MTEPMNELWRAQQSAAAQFTESWRTLLQPGAGRPAPPPSDADDAEQHPVDPEPDEVAEPEPSVEDAFQAIRALRDGQRDLAADLTRWAELQRGLADATTAWASRQRDHADALDRLLAPFSPGMRPVE